jgi:hypothetical protein
MRRHLVVLVLLAACAPAARAPPVTRDHPYAEMRRTTITYEVTSAHQDRDERSLHRVVISPGGLAVIRTRAPWRRWIERRVRLDPGDYQAVLLASAIAAIAEARPVRPDARWDPAAPLGRLTLERDDLRMSMEGPLGMEWRAALTLAGDRIDRATDVFRPYREVVPAVPRGGHALTIALPAAWPIPGPDAALVRYVYALASTDNMRVLALMAPMARGMEAADGTVEIELLGPARVVGSIVVTRMSSGEALDRSRWREVESLLRAPLAPHDEMMVRSVSCSAIARLLEARHDIVARHPDYVRWLDCRLG